ncbi:ATP-binding protein [Achromobacter sp. KK8]|jgi:two-component system sensor histidine kinase EvgS
MKRPLLRMLGCIALLCLAPVSLAVHGDEFSAEERAWIAAHPTVVVGARRDIEPLEYVENGKLRGLASEYLNAVSRKTGLKFVIKPASSGTIAQLGWLQDGTVDMFALAVRRSEPLSEQRRELFTSPYYVTTHIIVTRAGTVSMLDLEDLDGMTVGVTQYSEIGPKLRESSPTVKIVNGGGARETLDLLAQGKVDAVVGVDALLSPIMGRRYNGILQISGVIASASAELSMAMSADQPLLHSVVQKALSQITADEAYRMNEAWLAQTDFGEPSLAVLIRHYRIHGLLFIGIALLLSGLIYAFRWAHRQAVRSEQEKTKFVAVMSHEIRSPMNAVLASIELLRHTPLEPDQRHLVGLAGKEAEALLRLINNVLDISKLEAGKFVLDPAPTDFAHLVHEVVDAYRTRAAEKGLELAAGVPENCGRLILDSSRVAQVLHNLVSNGVKFTAVGSVTLTATFEPEETGQKGVLQIEVADTGIGIEPGDQNHLFSPYSHSASPARGRKASGTGLGLLVCRELVECMGGTIGLHSVPGVGTKVVVSLPVEVCVEENSPMVTPPRDGVHPRGESLAILLVEDTPANQYVIQAQLAQLGCNVHLAPDGSRARQAFRDNRFDLVLLDCDLPDTDGYTLAEEFRAHEAEHLLPASSIIAISASSGSEHVSRCLDAGMDGVLSKPIQLGKLRDTIEIWCDVTLNLDADHDSVGAEIPVVSRDFVHSALGEDLSALRRALAERDPVQSRHYAHRLRGASLTLGMAELAGLASRMEERLKAGAFPRHDEVLPTLMSMEEALKRAVVTTKEAG